MTPKRGQLIGDQLAEARRAAGMSQDDLGASVGAAGRTVSTWETGNHLPTKRVQATLEALYGWPAGAIANAIRTGGTLPPVTAPTGRPSRVEDETVRARAAQRVTDAIAEHDELIELLTERVRALEEQAAKLSGSRASRGRQSR
jgi:transcriptional regulator with XRE-family HTH domain